MSFYTKHKLQIDIISMIAFGLYAALKGWVYFMNNEKHGMNLFGFIIFTIMFIIKLVDVLGFYKNKKSIEKAQ